MGEFGKMRQVEERGKIKGAHGVEVQGCQYF
jgi:hypothetical protein